MNWKFWKKKDSVQERKLEELNEKCDQLLQEKNEKYFSDLEQALKENAEQINRLSRLQYKTGQELLKKITPLYDTLGDLSNVCITGKESIKIATLENRYHTLVSTLLQSIDAIDILLLNQQEKISAEWEGFLSGIQQSELEGLQKTGIQEIHLVGTAFNSIFAESVDSVAFGQLENPKEEYLPYEIIGVLKRGFVSDEGKVIRKAQVVTIRQKDENENTSSED